MPKKNDAPASFETALSELEQIVTRLERGQHGAARLVLVPAIPKVARGSELVDLRKAGAVEIRVVVGEQRELAHARSVDQERAVRQHE